MNNFINAKYLHSHIRTVYTWILHFISDDLISPSHTGREGEKERELEKLVILLSSGLCVFFMSVKYSTDSDFKKCVTRLGHFQVYFGLRTASTSGIYKNIFSVSKSKSNCQITNTWKLKAIMRDLKLSVLYYLDEIGMRFPRTHRILNHCLRRWRVCRHVRMTWGTICITPITTGSWVRWIAASIPICWVVIPGPLARVIAIRRISMCCVCWNESIERGVNSMYHMNQ